MKTNLLLAAFAAVLVCQTIQATPLVAVSPATKSVSAGAVFSLDIVVSSASDLYAYQFDLTYNAALLSVSSINEGAFLSSGGPTFFLPGTIDNVNGAIFFTADSLEGPTSGVSGGGVLATVFFTALAPGGSTVGIDPNTIVLLDSNSSVLVSGTSDSAVNITATPEPSAWALAFLGLVVALVGRRVAARVRG